MHLVLVKSGAPLTPLQLFCKRVILESVDRKIQRQESLREDAQEGFKLEELPAEMGERRGLISTDRSAGAISLGVTTSSLDKLADVIPKQLGVKERDFDAVEGYNLHSNRHGNRHFSAGTQEKGMDGRERLPLTSERKPKGIRTPNRESRIWARETFLVTTREVIVENQPGAHASWLLLLRNIVKEAIYCQSADFRGLPQPSAKQSLFRRKFEVLLSTAVKPQPLPFQRQPKGRIIPPSAPISLGNKQTPGPNPKSSAPSSSSSPWTSPTTRGLSGLYFALNLGAESKVNRDLGFKPPSPPSSSPVREPRSRRHRAIIRARAAVLSPRATPHAPFTRSPLRRSLSVVAPESTATEIPTSEPGDRGSATPFRSPGNREGKVNSTPKRKRSEPLLHYQQYAGGKESEEEMFIPDVAKLAETYEKMKQYEGQAFGSFGSPTRRKELPEGGVVRRVSELDALFEEDGDRVVEVDSDLAWKIERYDK
ncbi:uncharacterized protein QC761_113450 [Podospora bellae-mahoneyi]|uniref:Uncharacterized protein n=1 Tax=Podospora bellae-mahoneyi TaxID=2093777 RepID=A0ABR0FZD9_9PEZI|nr:hypothetical protein QC761_113450 [Podospora bellae-mahoneyi]